MNFAHKTRFWYFLGVFSKFCDDYPRHFYGRLPHPPPPDGDCGKPTCWSEFIQHRWMENVGMSGGVGCFWVMLDQVKMSSEYWALSRVQHHPNGWMIMELQARIRGGGTGGLEPPPEFLEVKKHYN